MSVDFHPLRVLEVSPLTEDSVAVTFDVPEQLSEIFPYLPGQHVTVRAMIDGEDVRRSYSICSNAAGGKLRVGIKRLPGGVFSAWAIDELRAGDVIEVMPPVGEFTIDPDPSHARASCRHRRRLGDHPGAVADRHHPRDRAGLVMDASLREQDGQQRHVPRGAGGVEGPVSRAVSSCSTSSAGRAPICRFSPAVSTTRRSASFTTGCSAGGTSPAGICAAPTTW